MSHSAHTGIEISLDPVPSRPQPSQRPTYRSSFDHESTWAITCPEIQGDGGGSMHWNQPCKSPQHFIHSKTIDTLAIVTTGFAVSVYGQTGAPEDHNTAWKADSVSSVVLERRYPSSETGSHTLSNENIPVTTERPHLTVENADQEASHQRYTLLSSPCGSSVPFQDAFTDCSPDLHEIRLVCASKKLPRSHRLWLFQRQRSCAFWHEHSKWLWQPQDCRLRL